MKQKKKNKLNEVPNIDCKVDDINQLKLLSHVMITKKISIFHAIDGQSRQCVCMCFFRFDVLIEMQWLSPLNSFQCAFDAQQIE